MILKRISSGYVAVLAFIVLIAFSQTGCRENILIDAKIDPNHNNGVTYSDSFSTVTQTVIDDSVVTSLSIGGIPMYQAVGTIGPNADIYFGQMYGGTYFQVIPNSLGFNFTGYTVDSAFVILPYAGLTWGDTTDHSATQTYLVYMADSSLPTSTYFYPFNTMPLSSTFYGSVTANITNLQDSVYVDSANQAPHLRIPLNQAFINYITSAASSNFTDNATFVNFFKGIVVVPDGNGGNYVGKAMPYFRLDESASGAATNYTVANILFYYHGNSTSEATFAFYFDGGSYCSHYNYISRKPGTGSLGSGIVMLQNQPGDAIDVKIGGIKRLLVADPKTGIVKIPIINKAELDIPIVGTNNAHLDSLFYPTPKVYVKGVATASGGTDSTYEVADRYPLTSTSALTILDGAQHTNSSSGVTMYELNIPREFQNALQNAYNNGKDTLHLRINGTQDYYGAYRAAIGGGNYSDPTRQLKLKVVYSKLK